MEVPQDTFNITYDTNTKLVLKYGSEVIITANKDDVDQFERAQNNTLMLICRIKETTPVTALQTGIYRSLPINAEMQKQGAASLIQIQASS